MRTSLQTVLVLATAVLMAVAVFHQAQELRRMRASISELMRPQTDPATEISSFSSSPEDIQALRRQAAEVQSLRAEISQLHREKADISALLASLDKPAAEVSAIRGNVNPS